MFKLILTCLTIPLVVYLTITMLVLVSPILIGGLMYLTYQANRREIVWEQWVIGQWMRFGDK
jgi:hypothetical protein